MSLVNDMARVLFAMEKRSVLAEPLPWSSLEKGSEERKQILDAVRGHLSATEAPERWDVLQRALVLASHKVLGDPNILFSFRDPLHRERLVDAAMLELAELTKGSVEDNDSARALFVGTLEDIANGKY